MSKQIKVGDIIDIDINHVVRGSRVLARIKEIFPPVGKDNIEVAIVSWIQCEVKPYLCDIKYDDLINLKTINLATDNVLMSVGLIEKSKPEVIVYPKKPKKGDRVICIDDQSENEDLGMSGIVLYGRHDLDKGREYEISSLPWDYARNVPDNKNRTWNKENFEMVRWGWHQVYLKGVSDSVFLHNFKPIN